MNTENIIETKIGNQLVAEHVITESDLKYALMHLEVDPSKTLPEIIVSLNLATEEDILKVIGNSMGYSKEFIKPNCRLSDREKILKSTVNLKEEISLKRSHVVIDIDEANKTIFLAISDTYNTQNITASEMFYSNLDMKVQFILTTSFNISLLQKALYKSESSYRENIYEKIKELNNAKDLVTEVATLIFEYAAVENASDIYFEFNKQTEYSTIYFRIDREKQAKIVIERSIASTLVNWIKNTSGMEAGKISGHQDGAVEVKILDNNYTLNLRISSITTVAGEHLVMRVQKEERQSLDELGFYPEDVTNIRNEVSKLKGIVVLAGVTGSGKTTTLYSMLKEFSSYRYNIITMEDPVEIRVQGIQQVQINEDSGQGFADTIRAALRQAPDIILLGEIRDKETAQRAIEAALTGHLVLTTIHTANLDPGILERLKQLKVDNAEAFVNEISVAIHQELLPKKGGGLELAYEIITGEFSKNTINKRRK